MNSRQEKSKENHTKIYYNKNKTNDKKEMLKTARKQTNKKTYYLQKNKDKIRIIIGFSSKAIKARRQWNNIFDGLKEKELSTQNSIPRRNIPHK